jgi:Baseplate J-like protein
MSAVDPQAVTNPPGLSAISDRVNDFAGFREALLQPLPGEQAIGSWRPVPGDLGLQVLEWWAYVADVLSFYNERHANESYLRTATRASSVANLVALLGYQPAPGIAASGMLAALGKARAPQEPLVIPAGMQVSSVASPGTPSQTFEVDKAASFTGPSTLAAALPADTTLQVADDGTLPVLLAGRVTSIKPGDQLLLLANDYQGVNDAWCAVAVNAMTATTDPVTGAASTLVTLSASTSGWQSYGWLSLLLEQSSDCSDYRLLRPTGTAALWNPPNPLSENPQPAGGVTAESWSSSGVVADVNLSVPVRGINSGDLVWLQTPFGGSVAVVGAVADTVGLVTNPNSGQPNIIVPYTQLSVMLGWVSAFILWGIDFENKAGSVLVRYGLKDVGSIIGMPATSLDALPASVNVSVDGAPAVGATALLQDAGGAAVPVTVTGVGSADPGTAVLELVGAGSPAAAITTPLAVPLTLLLDLIQVSRGKTVAGEVLGSGNAALANQSFGLAKSPLTYVAGSDGPTSTLTVYVNGIAWQEVGSFYGQGPNAHVFVVSRSADQTVTTVTFGDGVNGARLPSGSGNVVATYRYGSGAAAPPAGKLVTIVKPQPNLASLRNPIAVSGGVDPQSPDDVRSDAPASVLTFGRAVSAVDYEQIASAAPGVARATAYWTFDSQQQRTLITVYVGDDEDAVLAARAALAGSDDPNRPVAVRAATPIATSLSCSLLVAADRQLDATLAAATTAISDPAAGLFSSGRMAIGQPLYRSAVTAALSVPGVLAVHALFINSSENEVFDPGQAGFYVVSTDALAITGVNASG